MICGCEMEQAQLTVRQAGTAQPVLEALLVNEGGGSLAHARRHQAEKKWEDFFFLRFFREQKLARV